MRPRRPQLRVVQWLVPSFFVVYGVYVLQNRFAYHDAKKKDIEARKKLARELALLQDRQQNPR